MSYVANVAANLSAEEPREAPRVVVVRFVLEYCRPDPGAEIRAQLRAVDPARPPALSTGAISCHGATPAQAVERILRRLDLPVRHVRAGFHKRYPGAPWLWGPSARPDLDGDGLVPLAEISEGLTLPELLAALEAVAAQPEPERRSRFDHLPYATIREVREIYGQHVMEPRAAGKGDR